MGYHIKNALLSKPVEGYVIDYPKVRIAKGDLQGIYNRAVALDAGQTMTIHWDDNSGQANATATDALIVVRYSNAINLFETVNPTGTRDATTVQIHLPGYWAKQKVLVWATFATANTKLAATSTYLGTVTLA